MLDAPAGRSKKANGQYIYKMKSSLPFVPVVPNKNYGEQQDLTGVDVVSFALLQNCC